MGNTPSSEDEQEREELDNFGKQLPEGPNLRVNQRIVMFTSLSSSENLRQHLNRRKMEAGDCAADWIKSVVEKLGGLTSRPELAGLGALAVAILIDTVSFSPAEESTKDALRCVFAEQKASEVWDQVDECLKRSMMHINDGAELKNDIRRLEGELSAALTRLKNSMLRDGHMSSQALRAWVNGAAFHVQMLIHLVRLGGIQTCDPVERLLSVYLSDLEPLFTLHKEVITGKCRRYRLSDLDGTVLQHLVDEDSKEHSIPINGRYRKYLQAYYSHRYGTQQREIDQYFRDVRQNLQELVQQTGSFNVD